ncbi:hypothetical protein EV426DRAFT_581055 [Tirmania nivea]|nr:hypothetical protein EV426DRAFT_581055 [Tirmania nivea]
MDPTAKIHPALGASGFNKRLQEGICNLWKTTFSLELIATFLFLYMIFMSWQVIRSARYG